MNPKLKTPTLKFNMSQTEPNSELGKEKPRLESAFKDGGFNACIDALKEEIKTLYLEDNVPWILGYSGGKDSTAILQLIWCAIQDLPIEKRNKIIHVISTDTLVENPVVASWVEHSLKVMKQAANSQNMPINPHRLTPTVSDSFWVNLIGRGYPAPRHKFRWCTERLKIKPSNTFILNMIKNSGEAILVLGTRKAESVRRAANMIKLEAGRVRKRLSNNASLPGSLVYTPIESWTNDDVWFYLMQVQNPWGYTNRDLLGMYAGASADGECPLVVDTSTPSCGDSRFGCWVCTLVEKDKSMSAMIQNDSEKEWMMPLLEIRNALDFRQMPGADENSSDRKLRDYRRMNGSVQLFFDRVIPGPYLQEVREDWLRRLLKAQTWIRKNGPADVKNITLLTMDEINEIRRIWVIDKHEIEDRLPAIYEECTGEKFKGNTVDDSQTYGDRELKILKEVCGNDRNQYELARSLISIASQHKTGQKRAKLHSEFTSQFRRHSYSSAEEALNDKLLEEAKRKQVEGQK